MRPLALSLIAIACSPDGGSAAAEAPTALPQGTVLLVDDLPVLAQEVEALAADIRLLYPEYTPVHARRLALTNEILPRMAAHAQHREARDAALAACRAAEGRLDAEVAWSTEGNWTALGVALWSAARVLAPLRWSDPIELVGRWVRVRLDDLQPAEDPNREVLRLSLFEFPYVEPATASVEVERSIDAVRLTVVDPTWSETVPEIWKHRMRGRP